MKRTTLRVLVFSTLALLVGVNLPASFAQNPLAVRSSIQETPTAPEWLSLTIVKVKPDMLPEFQNFMRNQTNPALRKAGVQWRDVWQNTAAAGDAFEYVIVSQVGKLAEFDGPSPIEKALGSEGSAAWFAKAGSMVTSVHRYLIRTRPDLGHFAQMTGPPKIAVVTTYNVVPGRNLDFENYLKNDLAPVMKQGKASFLVSQTIFGGDGNQYVTLLLRENFAELDKGPLPMQVLGAEGAQKLFQKMPAGALKHVDRSIARYVPELSIAPPRQ
jgi:hypothetical protein